MTCKSVGNFKFETNDFGEAYNINIIGDNMYIKDLEGNTLAIIKIKQDGKHKKVDFYIEYGFNGLSRSDRKLLLRNVRSYSIKLQNILKNS